MDEPMTGHEDMWTKTLLSLDTVPAKIGGLAAAITASIFAEVNILLLITVAVAFFFDILSGFLAVAATEGFRAWETQKFMRGLAKKLGMGMLIVGGALADTVLLIVTPEQCCETLVLLTPIFKFAMVAVLFSEIVSIVQNGMRASGQKTIGQALLVIIRRVMIRKAFNYLEAVDEKDSVSSSGPASSDADKGKGSGSGHTDN